jgi:hypothetical protein
MVVPLAAGRQDQVEGTHDRLLPVHRGVGALAFHHEPQGALGVAMGRRDLAGPDQLQPRVEGRRHGREPGEPRVLEDQHAALGLFGADQIAGAQEEAPRLAVRPQVRMRRRLGLRRDERRQHLPERRELARRHLGVEIRQQGLLLVRDPSRHRVSPSTD